MDDEDRLAVHEEMRGLLDGWDSGALFRQLDRDFAQLSLFGLSALGSPPPAHAPADAPKSGPQPLRVEDPLLWLLGLGGLLPRSGTGGGAGRRTAAAASGAEGLRHGSGGEA